MRRLRLTQATVNALTTFNQRRLLEAQVETSFLLQPLKGDDGKGDGARSARARRRKAKQDSSSEESEEDFAFLDLELEDNK